jgi:peptide deformylase
MVYPIVAYGSPVLKRLAQEVDPTSMETRTLIDNMFETMYASKGVGLAAPQIGLSSRIFVVDASPFAEDLEEEESVVLKEFKRAFINPIIVEESGESWSYEEGCLSIPGIHEKISRLREIKIRSQNTSGDWIEEQLIGLPARIFQHEYDHIQGILFPDRMTPLKRRMIKGRLKNVSVGKVDTIYRMKFNVK